MFVFVQGLGCSHSSEPIVEGDSATERADVCEKRRGIAIIVEYNFSHIPFQYGRSC